MSIDNHEGNKLFLICPFCQMESFIIKHYGEVFFLTAPAAMVTFDDDNLRAVKDFIAWEYINEIYIAVDTSCSVIKNVLEGKNLSGLRFEKAIQKLKSDDDSLYSLTEKILKEQALKLSSFEVLGDEIKNKDFSLHLLITDKQQDKITEIR